jgi:hypothetical protein
MSDGKPMALSACIRNGLIMLVESSALHDTYSTTSQEEESTAGEICKLKSLPQFPGQYKS